MLGGDFTEIKMLKKWKKNDTTSKFMADLAQAQCTYVLIQIWIVCFTQLH